MPRRLLAATAAVLALTGCTSAASQRTAPTDPIAVPTASDTGGAVRTRSPVAEIDVCTAITPESLEQVLGVRFQPGVPGTPGGSLLGECDYVPATADETPASSSGSGSASSSATTSSAVQTAPAAQSSSPSDAVAHVYVAARAASQYARMVKSYQLTPTVVAGQQGAFGSTTGLLVHVPFGDYVLQVAVAEVGGTLLQTPAEVIAMRYITS